jgi:hypothetical protein
MAVLCRRWSDVETEIEKWVHSHQRLQTGTGTGMKNEALEPFREDLAVPLALIFDQAKRTRRCRECRALEGAGEGR